MPILRHTLVNEIVKYFDSLSQQYHESSGYDEETDLTAKSISFVTDLGE